jgi:predicted TIM-barrel fold metal-dependent hydrolase
VIRARPQDPMRWSFVIDCHAHALPPSVLRPFRRWLEETGTNEEGPPRLWSSPDFGDPGGQIESMDRAGIDVAITIHSSSTPAALHAPAVAERLGPAEMIRRTNEELRRWSAASDGRLLAASWVDPRFTDSALEEVERASYMPGARAISVLTAYKNADGRFRFLDHPDFAPVLALAEDLCVPVFVHASTKYDLAKVGEPSLCPLESAYLTGGLSMLVENTLCLLRLVLSGTLDRHPDIRLVFGQLGGIFPFVFGRFDMIEILLTRARAMAGERIVSKDRAGGLLRHLRDYTDRVYVDTHSMDGPALECAFEVLGPRRVLFGSDFPVTPARLGRLDGLSLLQSLGLKPDDRDAILGGTAADLLGIAKGALR